MDPFFRLTGLPYLIELKKQMKWIFSSMKNDKIINLNKVKYLQRLNNSYGYVKFMMKKFQEFLKSKSRRPITVPSFYTCIKTKEVIIMKYMNHASS